MWAINRWGGSGDNSGNYFVECVNLILCQCITEQLQKVGPFTWRRGRRADRAARWREKIEKQVGEINDVQSLCVCQMGQKEGRCIIVQLAMLSNSVLLGYGDCISAYLGPPYVICPLQMPYLIPNYVQPVELLTRDLEGGDRPGGLECRRHTRKTWTKHEDAKILRIIKELNLSINQRIPYRLIAKQFDGRTSKQIRQRYLNKLDSTIVNADFSEEDDKTILQFYLKNGPKWKHLSTLFKGRTPTSLKNRFNTKLKQRLISQQKDQDSRCNQLHQALAVKMESIEFPTQ